MASESERNLILNIDGPPWLVNVFSNNFCTGKAEHFFIKCHSYYELLDKIPSSFNVKNVKACIFNLFDDVIMSYKEAYEFRLQCRQFCEMNDVFCLFETFNHLNLYAAISSTKIMVQESEEILIISSTPLPSLLPIAKVIRENNYYRVYDAETFDGIQNFPSNFFENYQPTKVILIQDPFMKAKMTSIMNYFKKYNPVVVLKPDMKLINEASLDLILHLLGEKINPYHLMPILDIPFKVCLGNSTLFTFSKGDAVPFEKSIVIDVNFTKDVSLFVECSSDPPELLQKVNLSTFKCKKVKVTLALDINGFYDFQVVPVDENNLDEELAKLKIGYKPEKVQLIFDKQNFSVILFANGNKEYNIKDGDGLEKTPIYLVFTQRKPLVGKSAKDVYDQKPEYVVYDLIKLCSITSADVIDPKWKFKLSKEADSIMVKMQTTAGPKQSTVELLLAFIIRNAIKRILKATGEMISQFEIRFDSFSPNEILKKNFVEAGKLMKVNIKFS